MTTDHRISVPLEREDWEHILAALNTATAPTPLSKRLREAVDTALNERIESAVNSFMQASEVE